MCSSAEAVPWSIFNAIELATGRHAWSIPFGELSELAAADMTDTGNESSGYALRALPMTASEARSLTLKSTLAFVLAFNLTFFIQELFLVIPKALTPGLEPTLFHNNHTWRGHHPIEDLLQGSGALATVIAGGLFSYWLVRHPPVGQVTRLLMFWMAVLGFLAALPQVVIGSVIAQNDVGRALNYLGFTPAAKALASAAAMLAMAAVCWRLAPYLLSLIVDPGTPRGRALPCSALVSYRAYSPCPSSFHSAFPTRQSKCCFLPGSTRSLPPCVCRRPPSGRSRAAPGGTAAIADRAAHRAGLRVCHLPSGAASWCGLLKPRPRNKPQCHESVQ